MAVAVDQDIKKGMSDLQALIVRSTNEVKMLDMQIEKFKRQITHSTLVEKELSVLPEGTRTYEGVGRMFLLQPVNVVKENLERSKSKNEEKIKTASDNKKFLEQTMKNKENEIRELISSKRGDRS